MAHRTLTDLVAPQNTLQEAILRDIVDADLDFEEQVTALRDMASGIDPIYQFFGMAVHSDYVTATYHEHKEAVKEELQYLLDAGAGNAYYNGYRGLFDMFDRPRTHADFAAECLKLATWSAAASLVDEVEYQIA